MCTQQRPLGRIAAVLGLIVVLVAASLNGYSQPLATQYSNIYNRVYQNVGTKFATRAILPNEVRVDSMYQMLQALLGFTRNVADSTQSTTGTLDQVLNNGNFSRNSLYLGKAGTGANSQIRLSNDTTGGGEVSINDVANASHARLKNSAGWCFVAVETLDETIYMAPDNAIVGVGRGVTTDHLNGNGAPPVAVKYGATGDKGNPATVDGSDLAGVITFTTGASPVASDTIVKLTFNHSYIAAPKYGIVAAADSTTARFFVNNTVFIPKTGLTATICYIVLAGNVLAALSTYNIYYNIIGYHQ